MLRAALIARYVLLGVAISLTSFTVAINPASLLNGGLSFRRDGDAHIGRRSADGLLYQRQAFGHVRATLNAFFLFGAVASVASLVLLVLSNAPMSR